MPRSTLEGGPTSYKCGYIISVSRDFVHPSYLIYKAHLSGPLISPFTTGRCPPYTSLPHTFFPRAQFLLVGRLIRSHPTKDLELVREEIRNFLGAEVEKGDVKNPEPLLMAEIR